MGISGDSWKLWREWWIEMDSLQLHFFLLAIIDLSKIWDIFQILKSKKKGRAKIIKIPLKRGNFHDLCAEETMTCQALKNHILSTGANQRFTQLQSSIDPDQPIIGLRCWGLNHNSLTHSTYLIKKKNKPNLVGDDTTKNLYIF